MNSYITKDSVYKPIENSSFTYNTNNNNNNNSNALINEHQSLLNNTENYINNSNNNNNNELPNKNFKNNDLQGTIPLSKLENNNSLIIYLNYAFAFCVAGALISFVIALLGILLNIKTVTTIAKFLIAFGFASMLIFLFGLWTLHLYIKFLRSCESGTSSCRRECLSLFIYLIIILLFAFFILGAGTLAFKQEAKSYITALGQNEIEWQKVFGSSKYSEIEKLVNSIIIALGVFALTMSAIILTILSFSYCVVSSFRFTQTIVQFFCLVFFSIGAVLLYIALYADIYKDIANVKNSMPVWVPLTLMVCAVIAIIFAIFGYISIQAEAKFFIRLFCFIASISSVVIFACGIYAFLYSHKLETIFNGKCKVILDMLPEDFLIKNAGCAKKYVAVETFEPSDCPKERILLAWDHKLNLLQKIQAENFNFTSLNNKTTPEAPQVPDLFGCYDNLCCTAAYNTIASKSNYLKLIAAFLFVAGVICALGSYSVFDDLEQRSNSNFVVSDNINNNNYINNNINNNSNLYFDDFEGKRFCLFSNITLILLCLAVIAVITWAITLLPKKPMSDPSCIVEPNPSESTKVSAEFVINQDLNKTVLERIKTIREELKKEIKFVEKKDLCGNRCPVLRYNFELSSEDGEFIRNKTADWRNLIMKQDGLTAGNKYVVKFEGDSQVLNTFMEFFEFAHRCPMLPSKIGIKITGEVNPPLTVFIQNKITNISNAEIIFKQNSIYINNNNNDDTFYLNLSSLNKSSSFANSLVSLKSSGVIDYSKLNIGEKFQVMNKTIDYSFVSETFQVIKGKVFQRKNSKTALPIPLAEIIIENQDFPQCSSYRLRTNDIGEFTSPLLFIFDGKMKSKYLVTVNAPDLTQFKSTVVIGGIGAPQEIDLGNIELWSPSMLEMADLSATVLDSIDNQPVENVKVSIYQGLIEFNNEEVIKKVFVPGYSFLQIQNNDYLNAIRKSETEMVQTSQTDDSRVYKVSLSDYQGVYDIKELPPNLYTLIFEKEGFYREILKIEVMGKWTQKLRSIALTPFVDPGKIRVVLSWPDAPSDLDLYSIFKTTNTTKCLVFFGKTVCSKTHINVNNILSTKKGAETITIDVLEKYIYTFAVRKYVSTAKNNLAPNETRVQGAPLSSDYNYQVSEYDNENAVKLADVALSTSKAKVEIFYYGFKSAVQEINVPLNAEGNLLLDSDKNTDKEDLDWWVPFCLDGEKGLESLRIVNKLTSSLPQESYCESLYPKKIQVNKANEVEKTGLNVTSFAQIKSGNKMRRNI